jgi:phosphoadenosine phosphosulfate reductase
MEQLVQLQSFFDTLPVEEALKRVTDLFPGGVKFSSSLGQEDQVLTDIIARNRIPVNIFTIDTGRLFNELYYKH